MSSSQRVRLPDDEWLRSTIGTHLVVFYGLCQRGEHKQHSALQVCKHDGLWHTTRDAVYLGRAWPRDVEASLNYCLHVNAKLYKQPCRMSPKAQKYIFRVNLICLQQLPPLRCELFWITNWLLLKAVVQGHLCKYGPFICIMADARICKAHLVLPERKGRKKQSEQVWESFVRNEVCDH